VSLPRVLAIAGSDSGGGAGIQADIKTITLLRGFAMTAVTAVTVQNSLGVSAIHKVSPGLVAAQIRAVLADFGADAIKIGMLGDADIVDAVADALADVAAPIVLDPVMVAKGGALLLEADAAQALIERLVPRAAVLTPNVPELEALCDTSISDEADLLLAAQELLDLPGGAPRAVLAKGGHLPGMEVADWLVTRGRHQRFVGPRLEGRHTHGTGCTLASAVATGLAHGLPLEAAVGRARDYVAGAIRHAPGLGAGHGPLDHGWTLPPAA
jgi:hydroxymethylpyrimidine/phosphomethylpyrimidine kinase